MKAINVLFLTFCALTTFAQLSLEKTYTSGYVARIKLENSGEKYYLLDAPNKKALLYNSDHSLWKTITLPTTTGATISGIYIISETKINPDAKLEIGYSYYTTSVTVTYESRIINESGTTLLTIPGAGSISLNEIAGLQNKIIASIYTPASSKVYSIPTLSVTITLEHTYTNGIVSRIKLENSGEKYLLLDITNKQAKLYNANHSTWKTINLPTTTGATISGAYHLSETKINADAQLEISYTYYTTSPSFAYESKIINEAGTTLFTVPGASSISLSEITGLPSKLIASMYGTSPSSKVYSLSAFTLEHTYTNGNITRIKFENSGEKYYLLDAINKQAKLYNANHSVWKTINLPTTTGATISGIYHISENKINSDAQLELCYSYYINSGGFIYESRIINEAGANLLTVAGASSIFLNEITDLQNKIIAFMYGTAPSSKVYGISPGGNNIPPTVSITSPANGASFITGSVVAIAATAADADGTVSSVQFFVNGVSIGSDATAPYQINWIGVVGTKTLTAVATDNLGAQTTSAIIKITVASNIPPTVSITSPANGAFFITGSVVAIAATAADANGTVSSVQFFVNGVSVGSDATAPYQINWIAVVGTKTLTAVATDNHGAKTTSAVVKITVGNNIPPTISITSPANGASFITGSVVAITATASDANGTISSVQFFVNGVSIGSDATAPYQINWIAVVGTKTLTAVATDNQNAKTTSAIVKITVVNNIPPTVSITSPANGAFFITGSVVAIAATAADANGTVSSVQFFVNGVSIGSDATAPYQINWIAVVGTKSLTAVATDNQGAPTTSATVKITVVNNIPPTVSITSPANGASFITGTVVTIAATAADADGTVSSVQFFVNGVSIGSDATAPYQYNWTSVVGTASLTAVATDNLGAQTTSAIVKITVANNIPPTVSITSPANGASFITGTVVTIAATAADADGTVSSVQFFVNGVSVGSDATAPYQLNWTSVVGTKTLTAVATDNLGAQTTSAIVKITVTNPLGIYDDLNDSGPVFNVFPNPATDIVTIYITTSNSKQSTTNSCTIYSVEGNVVFYKKLEIVQEKYVESINISSFENGQYIIELSIDGATSFKKIIKN